MPAGAEAEGAADGGSAAAFEAYARDGQRRLYRTAYLLCGNVEGAKDLTQTTLAKLFQHWRRASRADNLDAYAKTVSSSVRTWPNAAAPYGTCSRTGPTLPARRPIPRRVPTFVSRCSPCSTNSRPGRGRWSSCGTGTI